MPLTSKERRALMARTHRLKPVAAVRADALSDATFAHVRQVLGELELAKLRVQADSAAECDVAAAELAEKTGRELVNRVGRIVVLYRPAGEAGLSQAAGSGDT